jgi:hypothetical protein
MSRVGWSLNLPPTLDHLPRSFAIRPSYAVPVRRHMPGWWRAHPGRSCFLVRTSRDRRSSRAHVRTNAARARPCRGGVVFASIRRRIQFLKGNHRRPLWGNGRRKARSSASDQIADIKSEWLKSGAFLCRIHVHNAARIPAGEPWADRGATSFPTERGRLQEGFLLPKPDSPLKYGSVRQSREEPEWR